MNRLGKILLNNCEENISFICIKLITVKEDYLPENTTFQGKLVDFNFIAFRLDFNTFWFDVEISNNFLPELLPMGKFSKTKHADLFVIEPSNETNFNLHCKVSSDTLAKCSKVHYRWLKNGAYQPDSDGKMVLDIKKLIDLNKYLFSVIC